MPADHAESGFRRFRRPRMPGGFSPRRVFWIGVGAVLLYLLVFSDFGLLRRWQLNREAKAIEQQISDLENRSEDLKAESGLLDDDAYLERLAREQHGMVGEGEHVYHLARPDTSGGDGGR
jgi:cell division protein FtsB